LNSVLQAGIPNPVDATLKQADTRNPMDLAILSHAQPDVREYRKIREIPFDFERRLVSVGAEDECSRLLLAKGAPESVLERSVAYEVNGAPHPMDADARSRCEKTYQDLCAAGFRVVGVGYRRVPVQDTYEISDERELVLAGFVT